MRAAARSRPGLRAPRIARRRTAAAAGARRAPVRAGACATRHAPGGDRGARCRGAFGVDGTARGGRRGGHGASRERAEGRPARRSPRNRAPPGAGLHGARAGRRAGRRIEGGARRVVGSRRRRGEDHDHPCFEGAGVPRRGVGRLRRCARGKRQASGGDVRFRRARLVGARSVVGGVSPAGEALGRGCGRRRRG